MSASIQMFAAPSDAQSGKKAPAGFTDLLPAQSDETQNSDLGSLPMSFAEEMAQTDPGPTSLGNTEHILPDDVQAHLLASEINPQTDPLSELAVKNHELDVFRTIKLDVSDDVPGQHDEVIAPSTTEGSTVEPPAKMVDLSYTELSDIDPVNFETQVETGPAEETTAIGTDGQVEASIVDFAEAVILPVKSSLSDQSFDQGELETPPSDMIPMNLTEAPQEITGRENAPQIGEPQAAIVVKAGESGNETPTISQSPLVARSDILVQSGPQGSTTATEAPASASGLISTPPVPSQVQSDGQEARLVQPSTISSDPAETPETQIKSAPANPPQADADLSRVADAAPARQTAIASEPATATPAKATPLAEMDVRMGDAATPSHSVPASGEGTAQTKTSQPALSLPAAVPTTTPLTGVGERLAASILQTAQSQAPVSLDKIPQAVVAIAMTSRSATLQIDPPEMGRIQLDYQFDSQGRTVVTLVPESEAARAALTDRMASILASLQQSASGEIDVRIGDTQDFNMGQNMGEGQDGDAGSDSSGSMNSSVGAEGAADIDLRQFIRPAAGQDGRLHIRV